MFVYDAAYYWGAQRNESIAVTEQYRITWRDADAERRSSGEVRQLQGVTDVFPERLKTLTVEKRRGC